MVPVVENVFITLAPYGVPLNVEYWHSAFTPSVFMLMMTDVVPAGNVAGNMAVESAGWLIEPSMRETYPSIRLGPTPVPCAIQNFAGPQMLGAQSASVVHAAVQTLTGTGGGGGAIAVATAIVWFALPLPPWLSLTVSCSV